MINISAQDLKREIDSKEKIFIVDVRTPGEISRGRIEGSINIPLDFIEDIIEKKVPNKNEKIYLYCLSGSRSIIAAKILDQKGYKNVFNVLSGILAWRSKGFPLV